MAIVITTQADHDLLAALIRDYQCTYGRQPDLEGLDYWYNQAKTHGGDIGAIANIFITPEKAIGSPQDFLFDLYVHALGRLPDDDGMNFWLAKIAGGMTYGAVSASFAQSAEFQSHVNSAVEVMIAQVTHIPPIAPDPHQDLGGTPPFHGPDPIIIEVPVEVIVEVPVEVPGDTVFVDVPTAEGHLLQFSSSGQVASLGTVTPGGSMLFGSGNTSAGWALMTDTTDGTQFGFNIKYRQSAEDIVPDSVVNHGTTVHVEYTADAGAQVGNHGAPVNLARSAVSIDFAVLGGIGSLGQDGTTQWFLELEGADHVVHTLHLDAATLDWYEGAVAVITDDPASDYTAQNSTNFAFLSAGGANVPAGDYGFSLYQVSLTGLSAGQHLAELDVTLHLV